MKTAKQIAETGLHLHTDHNGVTVLASVDDPNCPPGHEYAITLKSDDPVPEGSVEFIQKIAFQNGAVKLHGVNGCTSEALLAVLIHRTETLNGLFPCVENEQAIEHLKGALEAFESRTRDRQARQVEGQNKL